MTRRIATCLSKYPGSTKYRATIPGSTRDDQAYSYRCLSKYPGSTKYRATILGSTRDDQVHSYRCLSKYPGSTKYHATILGSTRDDQVHIACPSIPGVLSIALTSQDQPGMIRRIAIGTCLHVQVSPSQDQLGMTKRTATCLSKYPESTKYHATIPGSTRDYQAYSYRCLSKYPGSTIDTLLLSQDQPGMTRRIAIGACPSIPGVLSITLPSQDQPRMTRRIATCLSKYPGSTKYHATIPGSTQDDQAYSHMLVQGLYACMVIPG